jgi:serine-type D-Ala-D-Ala carboxypeptidase (penicillin-binding protein 5/6)
MNTESARLGMNDTHFTDCTGMPDEEHFSTPYDLAILSRALITHFPEYYPWYQQQWYTFNGIKQANRNRLLWRYKYADGIKTGHTQSAGYCLAASASKNDMRLIAVIMGAPTEDSRANSSQRLFNYGFRFYKTYKLYNKGTQITDSRVWKGEEKRVGVTIARDLFVTIPQNQYNQLKINSVIQQPVVAPIMAKQKLGLLKIHLQGDTLIEEDLFALSAVQKGGLWDRFSDSISLSIHGLMNKDDEQHA